MTPQEAADQASALLTAHEEARNAWQSHLKTALDASRDETGTPAERLALYKNAESLKLAMEQAEQAIIAAAPTLLDVMYWHEEYAAVYVPLRCHLMTNGVPYTPPAPPLPPRPTTPEQPEQPETGGVTGQDGEDMRLNGERVGGRTPAPDEGFVNLEDAEGLPHPGMNEGAVSWDFFNDSPSSDKDARSYALGVALGLVALGHWDGQMPLCVTDPCRFVPPYHNWAWLEESDGVLQVYQINPPRPTAPVVPLDTALPTSAHTAPTPCPDTDQDESLFDTEPKPLYITRGDDSYRLKAYRHNAAIEQQRPTSQSPNYYDLNPYGRPLLLDGRYWDMAVVNEVIDSYIAEQNGQPRPERAAHQATLTLAELKAVAALRYLDMFNIQITMGVNGHEAPATKGKTISETLVALALALEENEVTAP